MEYGYKLHTGKAKHMSYNFNHCVASADPWCTHIQNLNEIHPLSSDRQDMSYDVCLEGRLSELLGLHVELGVLKHT